MWDVDRVSAVSNNLCTSDKVYHPFYVEWEEKKVYCLPWNNNHAMSTLVALNAETRFWLQVYEAINTVTGERLFRACESLALFPFQVQKHLRYKLQFD